MCEYEHCDDCGCRLYPAARCVVESLPCASVPLPTHPPQPSPCCFHTSPSAPHQRHRNQRVSVLRSVGSRSSWLSVQLDGLLESHFLKRYLVLVSRRVGVCFPCCLHGHETYSAAFPSNIIAVEERIPLDCLVRGYSQHTETLPYHAVSCVGSSAQNVQLGNLQPLVDVHVFDEVIDHHLGFEVPRIATGGVLGTVCAVHCGSLPSAVGFK